MRAPKVDQLGYLPDAPKYAYIGQWLGGAGGPMNVSRWVGAAFYLRAYNGTAAAAVAAAGRRRPLDHGVEGFPGRPVFEGRVAFRAADGEFNGAPVTGEAVLELNFSAFEGLAVGDDDHAAAAAVHYRVQVTCRDNTKIRRVRSVENRSLSGCRII